MGKIGQGRQLKICTSLLMGVFLCYLWFFAEEEIKTLEKEYEEYKEDKSIEELLKTQSIKTYNLGYLLELESNIDLISTNKRKYYKDIEQLKNLPKSEKKAIQFWTEDRQWDIIVNTIFNLMDINQDGQVYKTEYDPIVEFLLSENKDHGKKWQKQFTKFAGKNDSFTLDHFQKYLKNLQKLLKNAVQISSKNQDEGKISQKGAELLDLIEEGIKLHYKKTQKQVRDQEKKRIDFFKKDYFYWKTLADGLFELINSDENNSYITDEEIRDFLKKSNVSQDVIDYFAIEIQRIDKEIEQITDQGQQTELIDISKIEFEAITLRIYQLYMDYNGVDLREAEEFQFFYQYHGVY